MLTLRIVGLIWRGTAYFVVNDTTTWLYFPPWRQWLKSELLNAGNPFWRQINTWHKMFKFSPLLIWYTFAIMNPFSWMMIAGEKHCPTSMAVWHQADWHTNLLFFPQLRSFVRPGVSLSFDKWHVAHSPPIRKCIWVGRYNNPYCWPMYITLMPRSKLI